MVWGRRHSDNLSITGRWSEITGLCLYKRYINGILIVGNRSWLTGCLQEITEKSIPRKSVTSSVTVLIFATRSYGLPLCYRGHFHISRNVSNEWNVFPERVRLSTPKLFHENVRQTNYKEFCLTMSWLQEMFFLLTKKSRVYSALYVPNWEASGNLPESGWPVLHLKSVAYTFSNKLNVNSKLYRSCSRHRLKRVQLQWIKHMQLPADILVSQCLFTARIMITSYLFNIHPHSPWSLFHFRTASKGKPGNRGWISID